MGEAATDAAGPTRGRRLIFIIVHLLVPQNLSWQVLMVEPMYGLRAPTLASCFNADTADRPAIAAGGKVVSYQQLFERVSGFMAAIDNVSVDGHCRIIINSAKCVDAYALELASVACGATFCPLNVDAPRGRNEQILTDFAPDAVFCGPGAFAGMGEGLVSAANLAPRAAQSPPSMRPRNLDDCAYVIYTSGTTGSPKGVQISYRNLEWFLVSVLKHLAIRNGSRWSNHPNLAFDLSILDLFGAVASRSTLFALSSLMERAFPARAIVENQLNVWHSVPSIVENMGRLRAGEMDLLRTLEVVILCGEPCRRAWAEYLLEYCAPNVRVYNAYGPTETTVFCVTEEMNREYTFDIRESNAPLGVPLEGAQLYLADRDAGLPELVIRGPGVGPGYVHLSPGEGNGYSVDDTGSRCYSTGDLVEVVNGKLYYRGRSDYQVKLRGNRFELTEIEGLLASKGISGAYSVVVGDDVVLFVDKTCSWSDSEIMRVIGEHIPSYAIPKGILRIEDFPRNVNDKVDRTELRRLAADFIAGI